MSPYIYTIGMLVGVVGMARTIDSVRLGSPDASQFTHQNKDHK